MGSEPPSTRRFRVGRNSRGNWIVQDECGLCGGLFIDRTEAVKFARLESGNHPEAVVVVPNVIELALSADPQAARLPRMAEPALRRVA